MGGWVGQREGVAVGGSVRGRGCGWDSERVWA